MSDAQLYPKKSFGQNFLIDLNITRKIIDVCELSNADDVIEIGPGKGAITQLIAPNVKSLTCIEKDRRLANYLQEDLKLENTTIVQSDFLKWLPPKSSKKYKVIGNLPYNVASQICFHVINNFKFSTMYAMVQLEHAQRMTGKLSEKNYSAFSLFIQYHADVKVLFKIKPSAFFPQPKVQSCFIALTPHKRFNLSSKKKEWLFEIIKAAFNQRRKTIVNSLSKICTKEEIEEGLLKLNLSNKLRAENITLNDYVELASILKKT